MKECCWEEVCRGVVKEGCRRSVVEKWLSVVEKVLGRSVVERCCEEML